MKTKTPVRGETAADYSETGIPDPIEIDQAHSTAANELDNEGMFNAKFKNNIHTDLDTPMDPIEFENQRLAHDKAEAATDNAIVKITPNPIPGRDKKPIDGWLRVMLLVMLLMTTYLFLGAVTSISQISSRGPGAAIDAISNLIAMYPSLKIVYNIVHRRKTMRAMSILSTILIATVVLEAFGLFWTSLGQSVADAVTGTTCGWACFVATFYDATSSFVRIAIALPGYIYFASSKQVKETLIYKEL